MAEEIRYPVGGKLTSPGPYLAKVISHLDPTYMGMLQVEIIRESGNSERETQTHQVRYISPFMGHTSVSHVAESPDDYNNTQKSYGMWMIPPDPGNIVVVIFVDSDPKKGYWFGCVQDQSMNFQVPGYAATSFHSNGPAAVDGVPRRVPVAEYNKLINSVSDATATKKPVSPMAAVLTTQGTINDDIRGITTSSARREIPSAVFGISTPGPIDKGMGAKRGAVGTKENRVANAFVSRLGGSSFVMDDGDDKFVRKTPADSGPPDYAAVESGERGNVGIPHNELIRIRTRTGHQLLFHNSEDLIYIINSKGTAWIELTSNGKIDIFSQDSISIHTSNDMNFTADRDINFTAGGDININAAQKILATSGENFEIMVGSDGKITTGSNFNISSSGSNHFTAGSTTNILSGGNHIETAAQIHMNGPSAAPASTAAPAPTTRRVPQHEPWSEHENLSPASFTPDKTRASGGGDTDIPEFYGKYTTKIDTFQRVGGRK